jgi:pre-rRNA-processing protein TSR4
MLDSVRAWRGLRFNEKYAARLEKKLTRKRAKAKANAEAAATAEDNKRALRSNPFSVRSYTIHGQSHSHILAQIQQFPASNPFGLGTQIFGDLLTEAVTSKPDEAGEASDADSEASASSVSDESLIVAMASTTIGPSPWASAPSYPPLYLSTTSEFLPARPKVKIPQVPDLAGDDNKDDRSASWAFEAYENSLEVDHVFDRFTKRVGYEGEQCVRYVLNSFRTLSTNRGRC